MDEDREEQLKAKIVGRGAEVRGDGVEGTEARKEKAQR